MPTFGGSSDAAIQIGMAQQEAANQAASLLQEIQYTNLLLKALLAGQGIPVPEHPVERRKRERQEAVAREERERQDTRAKVERERQEARQARIDAREAHRHATEDRIAQKKAEKLARKEQR
jgi:hypothetical protein